MSQFFHGSIKWLISCLDPCAPVLSWLQLAAKIKDVKQWYHTRSATNINANWKCSD
uniref:Uncharacterized protein n=1 Tax=Arundo donax TaxID=35708 RepID=A0A0A9GA02_ARUDO